MRFPSDLIYRWGRAKGDPEFDREDSTLEIPPAILPVVQLPGPLDRVLSASADPTVIQRESFAFGTNLTKAASVAEVTTTMVTIGRGLWRFELNFQHHADFTSAPGGVGGRLILAEGSDTVGLLLFPNIANVFQSSTLGFTLLFPRDSYLIRITQGVTGVGQTMNSAAGGLVTRLN